MCLLLVLEHFGSITGDVFLGEVDHAVLCKLDACKGLGCLEHVFVLYFDFELVAELLLNEVPEQFGQALLEVVFDVSVVLILVAKFHETLEDVFCELNFADAIEQITAEILCELVLCLAVEVLLDVVGDELTELFFALHDVLAEHLVVEFLAKFSRFVAHDFRDLEAEVCLHLSSLFLADAQKAGQFCLTFVVCFRGVKGHDVAHLSTFELTFLLVALHVFGEHYCLFYADAAFERVAFSVELCEQAFDHVAGLIVVCLDVLTAALAITLHLLIDQSVVHLDIVASEFVFLGDFGVELRSECDVEGESEVVLCAEIQSGCLFFVGQRLCQHVHLVLANVFVYLFTKNLIDFLGLDFGAETFLDE